MVEQRPIHIAMIGQKGYPPVHGGIEKHVAELSARLGRLGFRVTIYSRPHYSPYSGPTETPEVVVRRLPSVPTKHLDAITHSALASADVLFHRADIIHYHALGPSLLAWAPRCLGRRPTVATVHGLDWQREKWGPVARVVLRGGEFASVRFPGRTIVVSRALQEYFQSRHGRKTVYVPNGISPPMLLPPRLIRERGVPRRYVLFVGRLVPEKGCHLLCEAFRRLPEATRADTALVIAGDASFTDRYVRDLKGGAPPEANFLGFVHGDILAELYTNAEVVVLPSTLEGLSIALLEAMSYGRCCLVSDIPPNREAAAETAAYFPTGQVEVLAARLEQLLADPAARRRLGDAARVRVGEHYSWDRAAALTADVYRELVAQPRGGRM